MEEGILQQLGLTQREEKVYLALLELGETTTGKIIEKSKISGGKIYEILDKLTSKGLVSYSLLDKTKYFRAASPNVLINLLEEEKERINQKEERLAKELPQMLKLQESNKPKSEATFFKGIGGIQKIIFDKLEKLSSKSEILAMGVRGSKQEKYNIMWEKWHKERIKRKIRCKAIFSEVNDPYLPILQKMQHTETKLIRGATPSSITIMGDTLFIFTYDTEAGYLVIKNQEILESFKFYFQNLWETAQTNNLKN